MTLPNVNCAVVGIYMNTAYLQGIQNGTIQQKKKINKVTKNMGYAHVAKTCYSPPQPKPINTSCLFCSGCSN